MTQKNNESSKKFYRIVQIEGKITWRIEELWDGGVIREPYGSKHGAIMAEEEIAKENGFIDVLALQEVIGEEVIPTDAFKKDENGNWHCLKSCTINIGKTSLACTAGMEFEKGIPFMGVHVTEWLNENYASSQVT